MDMSKVLIVEDQPAVANALRLLFDLNDIETATARGPEAAVRLMERGDVDLVLQDMNFTPGATSGGEGIALFRRLRQLDPALPILLLTAWTSLETAVQLVKEGASDYLSKPWDDLSCWRRARSLDFGDRRASLKPVARLEETSSELRDAPRRVALVAGAKSDAPSVTVRIGPGRRRSPISFMRTPARADLVK